MPDPTGTWWWWWWWWVGLIGWLLSRRQGCNIDKRGPTFIRQTGFEYAISKYVCVVYIVTSKFIDVSGKYFCTVWWIQLTSVVYSVWNRIYVYLLAADSVWNRIYLYLLAAGLCLSTRLIIFSTYPSNAIYLWCREPRNSYMFRLLIRSSSCRTFYNKA